MRDSAKRLLVTGASGFIGRAVTAAFAADGHTVCAAVRQQMEPPLSGDIEIIHADLGQPVDWRPFVEGVDAIIHLGGLAHTSGKSEDLYDRINRKATKELALAAAQADVGRFIFISSVRAQTGPSADHVLTENDPAVPTDGYGRSKLAAEVCVRAAGPPFTILRPVLVYGRGAKGNLDWLERAAASPFPLPIKGLSNRRSLLGLDNLICALRFVLASPATVNETYLVADPGMAPTLGDIVTTLRKAQNRPPRLMHMPARVAEPLFNIFGRHDLWQRIAYDLQVDASKLITAGWQPAHGSIAGLRMMAQPDPLTS